MDVIIIGAAMPFGPETLKHRSLGGSETAQLMAGRTLAKQGHNVTQVTALPAPGEPDHIASGAIGPDGVRYLEPDDWRSILANTPCDLLVISREPRFAESGHRAKFAVFWTHDVAEPGFLPRVLGIVGHNIDEIWPVSHWHAQQIHAVTGYPLARMFATRNGIVDIRDEAVVGAAAPMPARAEHTLLYATQPERGALALLRRGGIMERLPEFTLELCAYDYRRPELAGLYQEVEARAAALANVRLLGPLRQPGVRAAIARASAYVYPGYIMETSCILARECIEQGTPFLTTKVGAVPETLGDCGIYFGEALAWNSDAFCAAFAAMVRAVISPEGDALRARVASSMAARRDLYWDDVVSAWIDRARAHIARSGAPP